MRNWHGNVSSMPLLPLAFFVEKTATFQAAEMAILRIRTEGISRLALSNRRSILSNGKMMIFKNSLWGAFRF